MIYEVNNNCDTWEKLEKSIIPIDILYEGTYKMRIEVKTQYENQIEDLLASCDSDWKIL